MSLTSLLFKTSEHRDLSALRSELSNDMNRCAAEIVNAKLREISDRKSTVAHPQPTPSEPMAEETKLEDDAAPFSFDDIEPYENETPK